MPSLAKFGAGPQNKPLFDVRFAAAAAAGSLARRARSVGAAGM